jgi:hypothetical protein
MAMKYAIITNGTVVNIAVADGPLFDNWIPADGAAIGDTWDGETFTRPAPPPPSKGDFRTGVQAHVDATAQSRDYDSGVSLASYVGDPNETWAAEAAAFVAWRSAVWVFVFDWLAGVEAETQAPPESVDALVAALPEIVWPE